MFIDDDEINNLISKTIIRKNYFAEHTPVFTSVADGLKHLNQCE
jgi:hypothetical protein